MTTKNLFLTFLLIFAAEVSACGQNPKREVVFTLLPNEIIYENEYTLFAMSDSQSSFSGFLFDTITEKQIFVLTGKRILYADDIYVSYLDMQKNEYSLWYKKGDKNFIKTHNQEFGGYLGIVNYWGADIDAFVYYNINGENGDYYLKINGVDLGPYQYANIIKKGNDGKIIYEYILADRWYDNKSGEIKMNSDKTEEKSYYTFFNNISRTYNLISYKGKLLHCEEERKDGLVDPNDFTLSLDSTNYAFQYLDNDGHTIIETKDNRINTDFIECNILYVNNNGDVIYRGYKDKNNYTTYLNYPNDNWQCIYYNKKSNDYAIRYKEKNAETWNLDVFSNGRWIKKTNITLDRQDILCQWDLESRKIYYIYQTKIDGLNYMIFNEKKYGHYNKIHSYYVSPIIHYIKYEKNGKEYITVGNNTTKQSETYGSYDKIDGIEEFGKYLIYSCLNGNEKIIEINGKVIKKLDKDCIIKDFIINKNGVYGFYYSNTQGQYINVNGKDIQVFGDFIHNPSRHGWYFSERESFKVGDNGEYLYTIKENGDYYVNLNGQKFGPFGSIINTYYHEKYGLYFWHQDPESYTVIKINGKLFEKVINLNWDKDTKNILSIAYNNNGERQTLYYEKRKEIKEVLEYQDYYQRVFDIAPSPTEMISKDEEHSFVNSYKNEFVVIDGKKYGKAPAIYNYYDEKKNSFIWNSVEGRELVIYEYKLD
jgi:hypothetical protein